MLLRSGSGALVVYRLSEARPLSLSANSHFSSGLRLRRMRARGLRRYATSSECVCVCVCRRLNHTAMMNNMLGKLTDKSINYIFSGGCRCRRVVSLRSARQLINKQAALTSLSVACNPHTPTLVTRQLNFFDATCLFLHFLYAHTNTCIIIQGLLTLVVVEYKNFSIELW